MNNNICKQTQNLQQWQEDIKAGCLSQDAKRHLETCCQCKKAWQEFANLDFALYSKFKVDSKPAPPHILKKIMNSVSIGSKVDNRSNENSSMIFTAFNFIFARKLKLGIVFSIIMLLAVFVSNHKNSPAIIENSVNGQFNLLAQDRVSISVIPDDTNILIDGKAVVADSLKSFLPVIKYSINNDTRMKLTLNSCKITLKQGALFSVSEKNITLTKGSVLCNLSGEHVGFSIKTPFGQVTPLGTCFKVEVKSWGMKVKLLSGKIEIKNFLGQIKVLENEDILYVQSTGKFSKKFIVNSAQPNVFKRPAGINNSKTRGIKSGIQGEIQSSGSSDLMSTF